MAFITWHDSLSVGVPVFDDEHKQLINLINQLHDAMSSGRGKDVLGSVLTGLARYVETHFAHEEEMFQKFGYEGADKHKAEHAQLTNEIKQLQRRFAGGESVLSLTLMNFLKDWLQKHIKGTDALYRPALSGKSIDAVGAAR